VTAPKSPPKRRVVATSRKTPSPGPAWAALEDETVWQLPDILALNEALEATETALQGMSMIRSIDVVLQFDEKVVAAHHDGTKWWVKFQ
jgi:hypothetical protein